MTVQWTHHTRRLGVELAVALDTGARLLNRATSPEQVEAAVLYNLGLWRRIKALAAADAHAGNAEALEAAADHITTMLLVEASPWPNGRDVAIIAIHNAALAGDIAGRTAIAAAATRLRSQWSAESPLSFERWLLNRLDAHAPTLS